MKTYRITCYDDEGYIIKFVVECLEKDSDFLLKKLYENLISMKELEE